ncbi:MAG: calcium-binding protein [Miltoncostaeaceae bacterium]
MRGMHVATGFATALLVVVPATATIPLGQQDTISDEGDVSAGAIAANDRDGGSLVAWRAGPRIAVRPLDAAGNPAGPIVPISAGESNGAGFARRPDVAYNAPRNEFLAVWEQDTLTGDDRDFAIFGRRLAADGTPLGPVRLIGTAGPPAVADWDAFFPAVTHNPAIDQFLVVYQAAGGTSGQNRTDVEIVGTRLLATGQTTGPDIAVSSMGGKDNPAADAQQPDLAYNPERDEYLVVWKGDEALKAVRVDNEVEIFGQIVTAGGVLTGADDFQISRAGPPLMSGYDARDPAVAYSAVLNEYLVVWNNRDFVGTTMRRDTQVRGRRVSGSGVATGPDVQISNAVREPANAPSTSSASVTANTRSPEYLITWADGTDNALRLAERRGPGLGQVGPSDVVLSTKQASDTSSPGDAAYLAGTDRYTGMWQYAGGGQDDVIDRRQIARDQPPAMAAPAPPSPRSAPVVFCAGRAATIVGTPRRDTLRGTNGRDVIAARGGNDVVRAGRGADLVCLGSGNDRGFGGPGNDRIIGERGRDVIAGGSGRDRLEGRVGADLLRGQAGRDRLVGGPGNDRLFGGSGRDLLFGGSGPDRLVGQSGRDVARGGPGRDRCSAERRVSC